MIYFRIFSSIYDGYSAFKMWKDLRDVCVSDFKVKKVINKILLQIHKRFYKFK